MNDQLGDQIGNRILGEYALTIRDEQSNLAPITTSTTQGNIMSTNREAVIVSTARTPIGKAYRGAFNDTSAQALGGHAIAEAVKRAGVEPAEVEDVLMGCALQQGATGHNTARQCAMRAGLPTSVAGMSLDRQCASGMMAIGVAAKQIINDGLDIVVGGGLDSFSLVKNLSLIQI